MVSQKQIKAAAKDSFFNPREPGPLAVIVKMNDPQYCENRAIEKILESRETGANRSKFISEAIALLLLAKVQRDQDD